MRINRLWVVTKAAPRSTMQDICFQVDLPLGLHRQFLGGLKPEDIIAFYDDKGSAEEKARHELHITRS